MEDHSNRIVILGGGPGGGAILEMLLQEELAEVVAMVDHDPDAPGMLRAIAAGIPIFTDVEEALVASAPCVAFNLTGGEAVEAIASDILGVGGVIGGLEARLVWRIVSDLQEAKEKLLFRATHDEMTDLYNRSFLLEEMARELHKAIRYKIPFSLLLIDLDHFKDVNDTHGHAAGDAVLKRVAAVLKHGARVTDVVGRWGGEEFLVILPHCDAAAALHAAGKWLNSVRSESVQIGPEKLINVTFSAGIAVLEEQDVSDSIDMVINALLARADQRLYTAKDAGRDCVVGE